MNRNALDRLPVQSNRETVYKDRANGRDEYFTYADGARVWISARSALIMITQGAKEVLL